MIQTFTNGPANPQDSGGNPVTFVNNGTLARFKYIPSMDAILAINSWINNAYILKISTGSNLPAQDTTAPTVPS